MKSYNKFIRKASILITGTLLIMFLMYLTDLHTNEVRAAELNNASMRYLTDNTFQMALWNVTSTEENPDDLVIKWWFDANYGKYYFFVPEILLNRGMYWLFPEGYDVEIDGSPIKCGSLCELQEGTYIVAAKQADQSVQEYTIDLRYSSEAAVMFFETESGNLSYIHEDKLNFETGDYTLIDGSGKYYYSGAIEDIHSRGNASWAETEKKSYQIKLTDKADLLGMGAARKWLLIANAFDPTLLRNVIAFDLAKAMNLAYTPDSEFVDVFANGEYIGNYILTEKIEIDESRVDIDDLEKQTELLNADKPLNEFEYFMTEPDWLFSKKGYMIENDPDDISGGYLLEIELSDRYGLEASGFLTSRMQAVVFKSPVYASYGQVSYIAERYQDFEDAIFSEDGFSPTTGAYFADYIDVDSFARKYLLEELTKNLDAAFTSQFFYKPNDSVSDKFYAGPAWDYDKAIAASGITNEGIDLHDSVGLYAATKTKDSDIWYGLYQQDEFRQTAISVFFNELEPKAREYIGPNIDRYADNIEASAINNALRWNLFSEEPAPDRKSVIYRERVLELKNFINERVDYLSVEWSAQQK